MESKKSKYINGVLILFVIIYTIYKIYETLINGQVLLEFGKLAYLIGFDIFAIYELFNKNKTIGLKIAIVSTIITTIAIIASIFIQILPYFNGLPMMYVLYLLHKICIGIILYLNLKGNHKPYVEYILFAITIIYNIILFIGGSYVLIFINFYISIYLILINKNVSKKITIIIIIGVLIFILYSILSGLINKSKYDKTMTQIQNINDITYNMPVATENIKYNNIKIYYKTSNKAEKVDEWAGDMFKSYLYNNIRVVYNISELDADSIWEMDKKAKSFVVNSREFYIMPSLYNGEENKSFLVYTNIKNDIYCVMHIVFEKNVKLTDEDLNNIRPFFDITIK